MSSSITADLENELNREGLKTFSPWMVAAAVMLSTFMEVLDTSVANVSLPHIAGSLSSTTDEATWVLTSYLIANAIVLPTTGWLGRTFGRKRFLLTCILIFTLASCACGLAPSLGFLIVARILQGLGGGALQPMSQAILLETFPREKHGQAMGVFALGVVVAPIIGPTLGGWITDNYSWHWIFLINLPIGMMSYVMVKAFVEDPPYLKQIKKVAIDYWGFCFLVLWLGFAQIVLDKGQIEDWFGSTWIGVGTTVSLVAMAAFIIRELRTPHPLVDLRIFNNRNFAIGVFLMMLMGGILYGSTVSLPIFLQQLMGYTAFLAGIALSPRGIGAFISSSIVGRIIGKFDDRLLLVAGFSLLAISSFWLSLINPETSMRNIIMPVVVNGVAISLIFVPMMTMTMGSIPREQMGNATGIFNLLRNLGGGIGISVIISFIARSAQQHQARLVAHLNPYSTTYQDHLNALKSILGQKLGMWQGAHAADATFYGELIRQSNMMAFVDSFRWIGLLCLLCIPLVFLFRRPQGNKVDVSMVH